VRRIFTNRFQPFANSRPVPTTPNEQGQYGPRRYLSNLGYLRSCNPTSTARDVNPVSRRAASCLLTYQPFTDCSVDTMFIGK